MAPPPAYASAAPRRRPSPRVPVPSMDTASFRRYLLTKRVLSLEEFRQEMRNKWSSSSPAAPASKAIPVPLYPGETLQQYTFKFKKWLTDKGEDLAVMRNDPNRERSFWHSFAHHRVGMLSTLTPPPGTHPKGQKRSVEDDYDDSYHRSASIERKRVRREKAVESERGYNSRCSVEVATERPVYFVSSRGGGVVDDAETLLLPRRQSVARHTDSSTEFRSSSRERDSPYETMSDHHRPPSLSSQSSREEVPRSSRTRRRTEILARRVLSARDYLREIQERKQTPRPGPRRPEERLTKVPVPLFPGETMHDYDQAFKLWLAQRHTSLASLRTQPLKERVYRHQYARQKVMWQSTKLARPPPGTSLSHALSQERGVPDATRANSANSLDADGPPPAGASPPMPTSLEKPAASSLNGKHIAHHPSCSLSQIGTHGISSNESGEPMQALNTQTRKPASVSKSIASGAKQLAGVDEEKRCVNVTGTEGDIERPKHGPTSALYPKSLPPWAQVLIDRVQELENKVTRLQEEVDRCHARNGDCSSQRGADQKHKNECCEEDALSPQYTAVDADEKIKDTGGLAKDVDTKDTTSNAAFAAPPQSGGDVWDNTKQESAGVQQRTRSNADIYREATVKLARAVQSRVAEDAEQRRLTEEYDRLNELIMMNETAIDDALAYVKAIKEVDEAGAQEHQSQIMELVVSINQEKERRSFALAAMITYSWSGREDELVSLLDVEISQAHSDEAKHEKCAAISSQIEEKDSELETLEMQMNDQLQSVNALAASAPETSKNSQFKALEELSGKLSELQTAKELLEGERRETLMCFLRGDDEIRKLAKTSVRGTRRINA